VEDLIMRARALLPAAFLLLLVLPLAACGQADRSLKTDKRDEPTESTTTMAAGQASRLAVDDVIAAFEAEGYEASEVLFDAVSANPDGASSGGLEVAGGELADDVLVDIELWFFADEAAAEKGAEQVEDEATDPDADGGSFEVRNGTVVALFDCTCEGDVQVASVFGDLSFA
jgi:hypothetical protein